MINVIEQTAKALSRGKKPTINHWQEARWIVEHVFKGIETNLHGLLLNNISTTHESIQSIVRRRVENNEPLEYILGKVTFCSLQLTIKPPILIPRIETEEWCTELINRLTRASCKNPKVLDLCTGSGCIALSIAQAIPKSKVTGVDINPKAINLANVSFKLADALQESFYNEEYDLVVSNPPYVTEQEWTKLSPQIKKWEDKKALVSGCEGLEFYTKIAGIANKILKNSTLKWLVFEIGHSQSKKVKTILTKNKIAKIEIYKDLFGKDRAIFASLD